MKYGKKDVEMEALDGVMAEEMGESGEYETDETSKGDPAALISKIQGELDRLRELLGE